MKLHNYDIHIEGERFTGYKKSDVDEVLFSCATRLQQTHLMAPETADKIVRSIEKSLLLAMGYTVTGGNYE